MRAILPVSIFVLFLPFISCKKNITHPTDNTTRNLNFTKNWSKVNGGSSSDHYWSGTATMDNGYVAVGYTASGDGDFIGFKGATDALVVKYNAAGNKEWQTLIGGSDQDYATAIKQLNDGTYVGVGYCKSKDGDISNNHGGRDAIIFKLSSNGTIQWVKALGGVANEAARSIVANANGTFAIAGYRTNAADEAGSFDGWICKVDQNGNLLWEKTYGGSNTDNVFSIVSDGNDGYVFVGYSSSTDGDITGNPGGLTDYWIVKINGTGNKVWHKIYGGSGSDAARDLVRTSNGYIITGRSTSNGGDVTGSYGKSDVWVLKLDEDGSKVWQQAFGGSNDDYGQGIIRTSDGGFFIGVNSQSAKGGFPANYGYMDAWVVKLDENGKNLGQTILGGSGNDEIFGFAKNSDSYILLGSTNSSDGDLTGFQNDFTRNAWILKFQDQ